MFVLLFSTLAVVDRTFGPPPLLLSIVVVLAVAFCYSLVVRALGVAPPVWQRS